MIIIKNIQLPKLDKPLVEEQDHEVSSEVVPLPGQEEDAVPTLRAELDLQLDVLVGGAECGEREPPLAREPGRPHL